VLSRELVPVVFFSGISAYHLVRSLGRLLSFGFLTRWTSVKLDHVWSPMWMVDLDFFSNGLGIQYAFMLLIDYR